MSSCSSVCFLLKLEFIVFLFDPAESQKSKVYNPAMAERLAKVSKLTAEFAPVIEANKNQRRRASSYAWRLLRHHADFLNYLAEVAIQRAVGDDEGAMQTMKRYVKKIVDGAFGKKKIVY